MLVGPQVIKRSSLKKQEKRSKLKVRRILGTLACIILKQWLFLNRFKYLILELFLLPVLEAKYHLLPCRAS